MEKISLPLHSQQALLTIGTHLKYPKSINGHSRISSRCSVGLDGSVPAQPMLCRTGHRKACVLLNACAYSLVSAWFLTNLSAGDGTALALFWDALPCSFFSEHCAFSPQTCWSLCQLLLWGCCCSKTTGEPKAGEPRALKSGRPGSGSGYGDSLWLTMRVRRSICPHLPSSQPSVPLSSATFFPLPIASAQRSVLHYLQQIMLLSWSSPENYYPLWDEIRKHRKIFTTKYLFLVGNSIRNRLNILKV